MTASESVSDFSELYTNICKKLVDRIMIICRGGEVYRPAPDSVFGEWCVQDQWLSVRIRPWSHPGGIGIYANAPLIFGMKFSGSQELLVMFVAEDLPSILNAFSSASVETLFQQPDALFHEASTPLNKCTVNAENAIRKMYADNESSPDELNDPEEDTTEWL